jgi:hypothetical protein
MNRYHVQNLAYFVEKLKNIPDGDGSDSRSCADLLREAIWAIHIGMRNVKVPVILVGGNRRHVQRQPPYRVSRRYPEDIEHAARASFVFMVFSGIVSAPAADRFLDWPRKNDPEKNRRRNLDESRSSG